MASTSSLAQLLDEATFKSLVQFLMAGRFAEEGEATSGSSNPLVLDSNDRKIPMVEGALQASVWWSEDVSELTEERNHWFPVTPSWQAVAGFPYMGWLYE